MLGWYAEEKMLKTTNCMSDTGPAVCSRSTCVSCRSMMPIYCDLFVTKPLSSNSEMYR